MDESKRQEMALCRSLNQEFERGLDDTHNFVYLGFEAAGEDPPRLLLTAPTDSLGRFHIPFETVKWQEWWGEVFFRRDGNDTPRSPDPAVAALQDQFVEVKRRHQQNYLQWREEYKAYLLGLEAARLEPPNLTEKYTICKGIFSIPFTTDKYNNWWDCAEYYIEDAPPYVYSPFEEKFFDMTKLIHLAIFDRRLDTAQSMMNELSQMVEHDRLSISSSIASCIRFPASL